MRNLLTVMAFVVAATQLVAQAPAVPPEPGFLSPNGHTLSMGGTIYNIKVEQILDGQGNTDHNIVEVTENPGEANEKKKTYNPANTSEPVNDPGEFDIQIWVGTTGDDTLRAKTDEEWLLHRALMIGLAGNDLIVGTDLADIMLGNGGNDTMVGEGGDDKIWAGAGNDGVYGVSGNNDIVGGAGHDQGSFISLPAGVSFPGTSDLDKGLIGGTGGDRIWGKKERTG